MLRATLWLGLVLTQPVEEAIPAPDLAERSPTGIALTWSSVEGCPDASAFAELLRSLIPTTLRFHEDGEFEVHADIRPNTPGFRLELRLSTPEHTSERTFAGPQCDALAQAASVVVATQIFIEQDSARERAQVQAVPLAPMPTPSTAPPRPTVQPEPESPEGRLPTQAVASDPIPTTSRSRLHGSFFLGVVGGPTYRIGPALSGMLEGFLGFRRGPVTFEAFGLHNFRSGSAPSDEVSASVRVSGGGVRSCWAPTLGQLGFRLCGGLVAGAATGEGRGSFASTLGPSVRSWMAIPFELGLEWPRKGRLALRVSAGCAIAVLRPRYHVLLGNESRPVWQAERVGVFVSLGPQITLP